MLQSDEASLPDKHRTNKLQHDPLNELKTTTLEYQYDTSLANLNNKLNIMRMC